MFRCPPSRVKTTADVTSWIALSRSWAADPFATRASDVLQDVALSFKDDQALLAAGGAAKESALVSAASRQAQAFSSDVA